MEIDQWREVIRFLNLLIPAGGDRPWCGTDIPFLPPRQGQRDFITLAPPRLPFVYEFPTAAPRTQPTEIRVDPAQ